MLVSSHLRILYCCAKESTFSAYSGCFDWISILAPVINSCYPEIQLHGLFLCGYLSSSLPDTCKHLWELSTSSVDLIMDLLHAASNRMDFMSFQSDFKFYSSELINSLQVLISSNSVNLKLVSSAHKIIPICQVMLTKGKDIGKKATCNLLLSLLKDQTFKNYFITSSILKLVAALNQSVSYDVKCLSKCVLMELQGITIEGNLKGPSQKLIPVYTLHQ